MRRVAIALGGLGLAGFVVVVACHLIGDPDLHWHMLVGRELVHGTAPLAHDDFSYTFRGAAVGYEYAADLGLYGVFALGGTTALQLLQGAMAALLVAALLARARGNLPLAIATTAIVCVAAGAWLVVRPALFAFPLWAIELYVIDRHRRDHRTRWLIAGAIVQLAWANLHRSAVLGAALWAGYAAYGALCGRGWRLLPAEDRLSWKQALAALGCAAVTVINPFGPGIFVAGPLEVQHYDQITTEWVAAGPSWLLAHDPAVFVLIALALAATVAGPRRPSLYELALVFGSCALAIRSARLIPFFAIACGPWFALRLAPLVRRRALELALAALAVVAPLGLAQNETYRGGAGFDETFLPIRAVAFAAQQDLAGPVWNFSPYGGVLLWQLYPHTRDFIDGRAGRLFPLDFELAQHAAETDPASFAELVARYHFEWAIVRSRPGETFAVPLANDPAWAMIYLDDTAAIYVRRGGANQRAEQHAYRVLRHAMPPGVVLVHPPPADALEADAQLAIAQAPGSARAHFYAVAAAILRHDAAAAIERRDALARIAPAFAGLPLLDQAIAQLSPTEPR